MTLHTDAMTQRWPRAFKFGPTPTPSWRSHLESLLVVALCGGIIYAMTAPAFGGFFYGEDFVTRSLYLAADENFFKAIFTPFSIFLRPSAVAWSIGTQLFLPWDPLVHHWRNFIVLLFCLWMLHRIMVRLVDLFAARAIGILLFAISKVHLTIIGLINCIDNLGTLLYAVGTILFLVRYAQTARSLDYWLALGCFALSVASRDANLLFAAVPIAFFLLYGLERRARGQTTWRMITLRVVPFLVVAFGYLAARFWLMGVPNLAGYAAYQPHFDLEHILIRLHIAIGNLSNLSFGEPMASGQGDLSTAWHFSSEWQRIYRVALPACMVVMLVLTFVASIRRDVAILLPLVWSGALLGPTLLIGNIQIYYIFEPLAGLGLFVAMGIDRAGKARAPLVGGWLLLLMVVAPNGYFSSKQIGTYAWRWVANRVQVLNDKIFHPHRGEAIAEMVMIADSKHDADFLVYLVEPVGSAKNRVPMLNALLSPSIGHFRPIVFSDFSEEDLRSDPKPRLIYRVDSELRNITNVTGRTVSVAAAEIDGMAYPAPDLAKLLARKPPAAPAAWTSNEAPVPHVMSLMFSAAAPLASVRVVSPSESRIDALEIQVLTSQGWKSVYDRSGLHEQASINARWPDENALGLRLIMKSNIRNGAPSPIAAIQRIEFPENLPIGMR